MCLIPLSSPCSLPLKPPAALPRCHVSPGWTCAGSSRQMARPCSPAQALRGTSRAWRPSGTAGRGSTTTQYRLEGHNVDKRHKKGQMHPYLTVPKAYFCYWMSGSYSLSCVLIRAHIWMSKPDGKRVLVRILWFFIIFHDDKKSREGTYQSIHRLCPARHAHQRKPAATAAFLFTLTSSPFQMQFAAKLLLSLSRAPDNSQPPKSYIFQGCCSAWKPQGFQGFQEFPLLCYATAFCLSIRERGKPAL